MVFTPPAGVTFRPKSGKLHFLVFSAFSIIFMKSEEKCGNDKKLPTFGVWAENDPPEPLKKHCPSKVFGRAGRRCAHFMKIGEIPGKSPKICTFSSKTAIFTYFQHFHIFAILRFRSISVPPPRNKYIFIHLGGGQKSSKCQETITATMNINSDTAPVINKAGFNRGPPRGPLSQFHAFSEIPRFRDFSTFRGSS